jgi:hypothetical protein
MPERADIAFFGALREDKSVHLGVAVKLGDHWRVIADLGVTRDKSISGEFAIIGDL